MNESRENNINPQDALRTACTGTHVMGVKDEWTAGTTWRVADGPLTLLLRFYAMVVQVATDAATGTALVQLQLHAWRQLQHDRTPSMQLMAGPQPTCKGQVVRVPDVHSRPMRKRFSHAR